MITDIRNLHGVVSQLFHRDHCKSVHSRLGDYEWIGIPAAFQNLLALYILLKVLKSINFADKCTFIGIWNCKQPVVLRSPIS